MKRILIIIMSVLMIFSFTVTSFAQDLGSNVQSLPKQASIETILSIEVGNGERQVAYSPRIEGIANDGPASFSLDRDNNIYILDTLNKKIMMYKDGRWCKNIGIYYTNHARDILSYNGFIYILDEPSNIYKIDIDGKIIEIYNLPNGLEAYQIEKLSINNKKVVAQSNNYEYDIESGGKSLGYIIANKKLYSKFIDDKNFEIINSQNNSRYSTITFIEKSGSINFVGSDKNQNTYISVQDDVPDSPLVLLEYTLRMIDSQGKQVGFARIPLEDYYNFPERFVNVTEDGYVYIMALKENYIEIDRVTLGQTYNSKMNILKEKAKTEKDKLKQKTKDIIITIDPTIPTRSDVFTEANGMINLNWSYKSTNSTAPIGATKPDYLSGITSFPSSQTGIPYCWGGFDGTSTSSSPSYWNNFIDAMDNSKFAGNVNCTGGWKSGTAGLDCSGFVSASYMFGQKYNCTGLHDMATDITYDTIQYMDIFVKPGSHVLFFYSWNTDKSVVNSKESTTSGDDKTKNYTRTKTWLTTNGYYASTMW